MKRIITVRGKKDIVAVYSEFAKKSGMQDTGRPNATVEFVRYISSLPEDENTAEILNKSKRATLDTSKIPDESVPSFIKIPVDIPDEIWDKAMSVFRNAIGIDVVQFPYFIRVSGMAYLTNYLNPERITMDSVLHSTLQLDFPQMSALLTEMMLQDKDCHEMEIIRNTLFEWRNKKNANS